MKEGMVFYRSWFEAMEDIPAEAFKEAVLSMARLGLDGQADEPEGVAKAIFRMARPMIEKNNQRYENGIRGGRKPNQAETKPKPNNNQTVTKTEPNQNLTETEPEPKEKRIKNTEERINNNTLKSIVPETRDGAPYQAVIDYLNQVCGTRYLATTAKTRELIRARHREGRTLDDFKKVIDRKAKEWLNTPQAIYLRPETLFGTKFDGYLNAPEGRAIPAKKTAFSEFHQRDYDYEDMQKALIRRQLGGA